MPNWKSLRIGLATTWLCACGADPGVVAGEAGDGAGTLSGSSGQSANAGAAAGTLGVAAAGGSMGGAGAAGRGATAGTAAGGTGAGGTNTAGGGAGASAGSPPAGGGSSDAGAGSSDPCAGMPAHCTPLCEGGSCDCSCGPATYGPGCPQAPPAPDAACTVEGAYCTYGAALPIACRPSARCVQGRFRVPTIPDDCDAPPAASCPPSLPVDGQSCMGFDAGDLCSYPGASSHCLCQHWLCQGACTPLDPPQWYCVEPNTEPGCPALPPNAGTLCEAEVAPGVDAPVMDPVMDCVYDLEPCISLRARCVAGVWRNGFDMLCGDCAAPDTPIATPDGERAIASLQPGELVYTVDEGALVAVPILAVGQRAVNDHHVMHLRFAGGGELWISANHPDAAGRPIGLLRAGDHLGERSILDAAYVPYPYASTHDILPASSSGTYIAAGALVGSTLR